MASYYSAYNAQYLQLELSAPGVIATIELLSAMWDATTTTFQQQTLIRTTAGGSGAETDISRLDTNYGAMQCSVYTTVGADSGGPLFQCYSGNNNPLIMGFPISPSKPQIRGSSSEKIK